RGDVRHDAQREQRQPGERSTGEQLEEGEDAPLLRLLLQRLQRRHVDPGDRDERAEAVDRDHRHREQHLVAQLRDAQDVLEARDHGRVERRRDVPEIVSYYDLLSIGGKRRYASEQTGAAWSRWSRRSASRSVVGCAPGTVTMSTAGSTRHRPR